MISECLVVVEQLTGLTFPLCDQIKTQLIIITGKDFIASFCREFAMLNAGNTTIHYAYLLLIV